MSELERFEVPVVWVGAEETPIHFVNAFTSQFDNMHGFIVTLGQLTPPLLMGSTPEELREQVENVNYVHVKPVARLGLTRDRLAEFVATLSANLDQYDRAQESIPGDPR